MAKTTMGGLVFVAALLASPALGAVMSRVNVPHAVKFLSKPADTHMVALSSALARDVAQLEEKLKAVSTPGSPDYGKYLDKNDLLELFPTSDDAAVAVVDWLTDAGVEYIAQSQEGGSSINFATTVENANALLNASFAYYDVHGVQKLRTTQYSVPDEVAAYVDLIHPTTFFGRSAPMKMPTTALKAVRSPGLLYPRADNCSALITPDCLWTGYNKGNYTPDPTSGSRVGFGSFLNETARYADQALYQNAYGIPLQNFSELIINGGLENQNTTGSHGEANLDAQFQNAMSYPLPQTEFITGGSPPFIPNLDVPADDNSNEPYLEFFQYLLENKTNEELPQVISISYGDDEQTVPLDYAQHVCSQIGMMGLRGISILGSSGDTGVGAPCITNDGTNKTEFTPAFPTACPCMSYRNVELPFVLHHSQPLDA
jgi:tripeptidyl-peptidase-1